MAERKVLSKYYPADFDPAAIPKKRSGAPKAKDPGVRIMTPYSMRCLHCGEFIPKGLKFNAGKDISDERYMSIRIIRFIIKCPGCKGVITFKTDPKNAQYAVESGAKRNFEPWRDETETRYHETEEQTLDRLELEMAEQEEEAERDKMAELEEKMLDSKREMAIADALDEIRTRNARIERNEARGEDAALVTAAQKKIDEESAREAAKNAWIEEGVEEARRNFKDIQRKAREEQLEEEEREHKVRMNKMLDANPFKNILPKGPHTQEGRRAQPTNQSSGPMLMSQMESKKAARLAARKEERRKQKQAQAAKAKQEEQSEKPADKPT